MRTVPRVEPHLSPASYKEGDPEAKAGGWKLDLVVADDSIVPQKDIPVPSPSGYHVCDSRIKTRAAVDERRALTWELFC